MAFMGMEMICLWVYVCAWEVVTLNLFLVDPFCKPVGHLSAQLAMPARSDVSEP